MLRCTFKVVTAIAASALLTTLARADILVTPEEALLPPPKGAVAVTARGITRGPKVEYVPQAPLSSSPAMLKLKFESFGGATIDLNTVKVTYLRTPSVDVTARVKPFLQPNGIIMPGAELPPGDHFFRVDLIRQRGAGSDHDFSDEDRALKNCPLCLHRVDEKASVCSGCGRDIAPPKDLLEERDMLLARRIELKAALEQLQSRIAQRRQR